jgi:pyruvate, water dikinase
MTVRCPANSRFADAACSMQWAGFIDANMFSFTIPFEQVELSDIAQVGGKNASLGELTQSLAGDGVAVPRGFALTAQAFREHLLETGLFEHVYAALAELDSNDVAQRVKLGAVIRQQVLQAPLPAGVTRQLTAAYARLSASYGESETDVAVRCSATGKELPPAPFGGQQESHLNVRGRDALLAAVRSCMASLFTDRAIAYRAERGIDHRRVGISVGVQKMVRSDLGSAGAIFMLDTERGSPGMRVITSAWGLGESVGKGRVNPDEFWVREPLFEQGVPSIVVRDVGDKRRTVVYAPNGGTREAPTAPRLAGTPSLKDEDVLTLSRWALAIERHYSAKVGRPLPLDIQWARDGRSGDLFVVQARPDTMHAPRRSRLERFGLGNLGPLFAHGKSGGNLAHARHRSSLGHTGDAAE